MGIEVYGTKRIGECIRCQLRTPAIDADSNDVASAKMRVAGWVVEDNESTALCPTCIAKARLEPDR